MRGIGVTLALLVATGCQSGGDVSFEHRSSLETRARGFGIHDDGASAQVGMAGNTCEVETASGMIGNDYDVAVAEEDEVLDTMGVDTLVIGPSGDGIFTISRNQWFEGGSEPTVAIDDVNTARFTEDGIVAMQDGTATQCDLGWYENGDQVGAATLPSGACGGQFTVDRATGTAFVPTGDGLLVASKDGTVTEAGQGADLAAWDATAAVLYTARAGDSLVNGLEADGTVRWSTDVGMAIASLDDMGSMGAAAVMVGDSNGGAIITIDGVTGEIKSEFATPGTAEEIKVNGNASVLAVRLADELHFYGINLSE